MPRHLFSPGWQLFVIFLCFAVIWPNGGMAVPLADLSNRHNMSSAATHSGPKALPLSADGTDQICIFCHTPHAAAPESTLWSRPDPNTATFPLYGQTPYVAVEKPLVIKGNLPGSPVNAQAHSQYKNDGTVTYPNGASRMCLSCHDGATAIGILRDNTTIAMAAGKDFITGSAVIDLSTSHPISFVYNNQVLADILAARTAGYQLPDTTDAVDTPLDGLSRMQCTTCHDPHDDTRTAIALPFWRQTSVPTGGIDPYSDVCNACHTPKVDKTPPTTPTHNM